MYNSFALSMNQLVIRTGGISHDILIPAVKDKTEIVDCRRIQWFVFTEFVNNSTGNVMFFDKRIGSFIRPLQSFPKWCINDQLTTSFYDLFQFYEVVFILTIFRIVTIIIIMTI